MTWNGIWRIDWNMNNNWKYHPKQIYQYVREYGLKKERKQTAKKEEAHAKQHIGESLISVGLVIIA